MHRVGLVAGKKLPCFFSGESTDRGEHPDEPGAETQQCCLRGASAKSVGAVGIKSILHTVMVNRREFHRHKLADSLVNHVIFKSFIGVGNIALHGAKSIQNPAV